MSATTRRAPDSSLLDDVGAYAAALRAWLACAPPAFVEAARPIAAYSERVVSTSALMRELYDAGWSRYGWPQQVGGFGGDIRHRGAMWEALADGGLTSMALFEHLEVLAPTLVAMGRPAFVARVLPEFLRGGQCWSQGFSEPESGSDLASLRTRAVPVEGGHLITGRKIWTSWARYARWCLVLARTGTPQSRHRGLTAFAVDLHSPGVTVRPIEQANGTDELAEVSFDDVPVGPERQVGELDGGWPVATHILSHERGTYAWFRHCFLHRHLLDNTDRASDDTDRASADTDDLLGDAILDLAAVRAASRLALHAHAAAEPLGVRATFVKLMLCAAERSLNDWVLAADPGLALGPRDEHDELRWQEYLFSRIVTVYGGSQQMQLDTIAKQILRLP